MITGISLHYSNELKQSQILKRYCGDFGFYGKSLTLFTDGTFNFSYHGCSQQNGYVKGDWEIENNKLILGSIVQDVNLNGTYQIDGINLTSDRSNETKFIICEFYEDPLERMMKKEK